MTRVKNTFKASTDPGSLGSKFRQKRVDFFKELIQELPKPVKILDVGGREEFWVNSGFHKLPDIHISIINLKKQEVTLPNFTSEEGDATNLSQFADNDFDLVFSNSVIEHLYTKENQIKMAKECARVGKHYFVQTPNKYFFMEPHYLLPFFQFLPKSLQLSILTKTKLSRMRKWPVDFASQYLDEIRLLSLGEMKEMFPDSNIWREKFWGMSKSFTAHNLLIGSQNQKHEH